MRSKRLPLMILGGSVAVLAIVVAAIAAFNSHKAAEMSQSTTPQVAASSPQLNSTPSTSAIASPMPSASQPAPTPAALQPETANSAGSTNQQSSNVPVRITPGNITPGSIKPGSIKPGQIIPGKPGEPPTIIPAQITPAEITPPSIKPLVVRTSKETRITLAADVLFDFDQANIRPDANAALQQMLSILQAAGSGPIKVEGYTDSKGSNAYNLGLSDRRAAAVKQWLGQHNIPLFRMTTAGYGEAKPVAPNTGTDGSDNPAGRQKNRRVEIVVRRQA